VTDIAEIDRAGLKEVFFGKPLYTNWVNDAKGIADVISRLRLAETSFDHYCPHCDKETVWRIVPTGFARNIGNSVNAGQLGPNGQNRWISDGSFELFICCERVKYHAIRISFFVGTVPASAPIQWQLVKYGQFPSLIDLNAGSKEFSAVLNKNAKIEYRRALELTAYGYNIGAFVHYRRVLELLIDQAKDEAVEDNSGFDLASFQALTTTQQRVKALGDRIPQFIADRPEMYRILSEGVHEWSEAECGAVLPLMKLAIDTVLEQEHERKIKANRKREIALQLQQLDEKIGAGDVSSTLKTTKK